MKLFTLYADLALDSTNFNTGVTSAKETMTGLQTDISKAVTNIDDELAALDTEIENLELEIANMELDLELDDIEEEIGGLTKQIKGEEFKNSFLEGFYGGLTDAASEMLGKAVEAGIEFLGDSVEAAAQSSTEAADAYNLAMMKMSVGTENLKMAIGNKLLPLLTSVYEFMADLLGVEDSQIVAGMLDQLDSYRFDNLQQAEESLRNIFTFGQEAQVGELEQSFDDVLAGIQSQKDYWENYKKVVADLTNRGFDNDILSMFLGGSTSDYAQLKWYSELTNEQLSQLSDSYREVNEARSGMASMLSTMNLENDAAYQDMERQYEQLKNALDADIVNPEIPYGFTEENAEALRNFYKNNDRILDLRRESRPGEESGSAAGADIAALASAVSELSAKVGSMTNEYIVNVQIDGNDVAAVVERTMARNVNRQARG